MKSLHLYVPEETILALRTRAAIEGTSVQDTARSILANELRLYQQAIDTLMENINAKLFTCSVCGSSFSDSSFGQFVRNYNNDVFIGMMWLCHSCLESEM